MTRAMAADLERRGYIVYVTVSSADEEHIVQSESRADIKPLWLDLTTVSLFRSCEDSISNGNSHLPCRRKSILHYMSSVI
jgi:hypothetical protein